MIVTITLLLFCQFAGEVFVRWADLPVPGPVAGLVILAVLLLFWVRRKPNLDDTDFARQSQLLIGALGLFLVPAGAGVVNQLGMLQGYGLGIAVTTVVSAILTLAATVLTFVGVKRLLGDKS